MIKWLMRIFGAQQKSPYTRGRDYAYGELLKHGWEVKERLYSESDGCFNTTHSEREFDRGVRDMIRDFDAQQRETVRNMLK
jgi:hypothetical protein